jgi:phosphoribosylamine--glycine ligase
MKVLVVGTGAREHAICNALKDDVELYAYTGKINPGISKIANYKKGSEEEVEKVAEFAKENEIEIAVIGPESPLGKGIVDELEKNGIKCVGPNKDAARIETDKSFMRNLFEKYEIPGSLTYKVFDNYEDISKFLDDFDKDAVIKPVGLTGGKGVKIVGEHLKDNQEAKLYAKEVMDNAMGGFAQVIIEERLIGEEFTIQAFCDGKHLAPMPAAQDHPQALEGDKGDITGGMGSYSDKGGLLPFLTQEDYDAAVKIMEQTIEAISKETKPYKGILYGQFMLCKDGPRLVEYNARFGDPEAMNVLPLLKTRMIDVCENIVNGTLDKVEFEDKASVCKYIVPDGYPDTEYADTKVDINEEKINELGANVFYAAVNQKEDGVYLSGSRALGIVAQGESIAEAEVIAEKACQFIKGNVYHRRDVGTKTLIDKRVQHMDEIINKN